MSNRKTETKGSHSKSVHYVLDEEVVERLAWFCNETKLSKTAAIEHAVKMYVDYYEKTGLIK